MLRNCRRLLAATILLGAGCTSTAVDSEIAALSGAGGPGAGDTTLPVAPSPAPGGSGSDDPPTPPDDSRMGHPSTTGPVGADGVGLRRLVDGVLVRYARALTTIASDPREHAVAGTPAHAAWHEVVHPASPLHADVLGHLVRRQDEQRMVVLPDQGPLSYRHHPLLVEGPAHDTISFTWCGWSPGIGIDDRTGEVLDDGVAHSHGTGQLRLHEDRWVLETLDQLDLVALDPRSPDPCQAEVAEAERADAEGAEPAAGS